jgi:two-component system CheB/CheR fusion protein
MKEIIENSFPIVAIGASAGGLEAVAELLNNLPSDTGMAYIYVQHLSPDHKSKLTEILSNKTEMKVQEIHDLDEIRPNTFFVMPSDKGIEVSDGHIKLIPRSKTSSAVSIDILFSSLAQAQKQRVIGIILSGSANDGTVGIKAIKHHGGLTFAQDDTAKFTSMPKSAIAAGVVDFILSPEEIAHELERLSKQPLLSPGKVDLGNSDINRDNSYLKIIFSRLHKATGVDFSSYKLNTIVRRITRRMVMNQITTLKEYSTLLTKSKEEVDILFQDLLINVTNFFRDTDSHNYLKDTLFPKLLGKKNNGESLRIWVPACSTGEEAYSIAMMMLEIQGSGESSIPVQIFATDLSERAIAKARIGIYKKQELETISPKRIQRFFTKTDGSFRVNKAVRAMCAFAPHNILRDPPFSRLDFISCCNLFIYFDTAAQKKATNIFHYALNNDGFLMLGKSESISHSTNLFTKFNKEYKIYTRKGNLGLRKLPELSPRFAQDSLSEENVSIADKSISRNKIYVDHKGLENAIDALLISEFMPVSVVINHQMEIAQFRGKTDLYLTHPKGKATLNIIKMARPEIAFELRTAISKVIKTNEHFRKSGIEVNTNSGLKVIKIEIAPLKVDGDEPLLLVLFTEQEQVNINSHEGKSGSPAKDRRIKKLEQELALAKADALASSQEQEAFTEELQSAHEEVVSTNEELQTVNEELETSKEELESANEELIVTVQELQTRNELLNESYEYSEAILNTMNEPLLVLGNDLRVKSANKAFYEKFSVSEAQTEGELLFELGNKQWDIPALREPLEHIIPKNTHLYNFEVKHTFQNLGEKIMSLNASRLIQKTHHENLILLILSDITEVRHLQVEKERREKELINKEISKRKEEKLILEKAVNERTHQLKEANESLEEKNKEMEAFAYAASHDLQEPLRMITSYMDLLAKKYKDQLDDKAQQYIFFATDGAGRMKQLILDILEYSRAGRSNYSMKQVNLNHILSNYKQLRRKILSEKSAIISVSELPTINSYNAVITQVFHSLLDNAIKYSKEGVAPNIEINATEETDIWKFSIKDNGIGIDPKFYNKIFIVFQRLHNRNDYEGKGIGLSVAKKNVESLGGKIWVESKEGEGSVFYFTIPKA